MHRKFSYAKQRNTPCNVNAQKWYMIKSINGVKTEKNPVKWYNHYVIANYLNGNAHVINN
jgi:hypothetical protein